MERKRIQVDSNSVNTSNGNTNGSTNTTPLRKESLHIAGGKNAGIVVNKDVDANGKYILFGRVINDSFYLKLNGFSNIFLVFR